MNQLCPKFSLLPSWSLVALAGIILALSMSARVSAQDSFSGATDTSINSSTDTATDGATTENTNSDSASAAPSPTPTGSPPPASIAATSSSGTPNDYDGPVGVTGIFNGNVTSGCEYDPLSHNARRQIDDIIVPGSIGKYPLKMTRYFDSRGPYPAPVGLGPGWQHEYGWLIWANGSKVISPHGSTWDYRCDPPVGVSEKWESHPAPGDGGFRLADGGTVVFTGGYESAIIDPYGQTTTITRSGSTIDRITEPGGRYLKFYYNATQPNGSLLVTRVEAYDGSANHLIDWVNYTYSLQAASGSQQAIRVLTQVTYSDGTVTQPNVATYTYRNDNVAENPPTSFKSYPLLATCDDVRYSGPMRHIDYDYDSATSPQSAPHGAITKEKYQATNGLVSKIDPPLLISQKTNPPRTHTETRGDGPTRTFTYTPYSSVQNEGTLCPDVIPPNPPTQFLLKYTDFLSPGNTTYLDYDSNWYVNSVTDARGASPGDPAYTTKYLRGPPPGGGGIGQILQITHPDGTYTAYTYFPDPHYRQTTRDERGNTTTYRRDDPNNPNAITEIDPPDGGIDTFSYNAFGQVLTHRMPNNSDVNGSPLVRYKHFQYDFRGLLTAEWNPTTNSTALASDPKTTYTYYNPALVPTDPVAWIDRVKTKMPPANAQGLVALEIYEYDRAFDANGESTGTPCAGRGLVTKISYPNDTHNGQYSTGTFKSCAYDKYGNKKWEENELRQRTRYTYDNFNRLQTVSLPSPGGTTTNDYSPTKGNTTLCYQHTTNSPYFVTDPVNIVTTNTYDNNWRKSSTTVGYGNVAPFAATTRFGYDVVGNQTQMTDPRGTGLGDATYTTTTAYDPRNRKTRITDPQGHVTSFFYEDNINLTRIVRPDTSAETKHYDPMNRVDSDTVPKAGPPASPTETITTTFAYNPSGSLKSVTVPQSPTLNLTTRFGYDPSDLKTAMLYPNGTETQGWTYDNLKNLSSRRTVNGATQIFTYDSRNRKIGMTWSNGADSATFDYEAAGRLITANNPNSSITRQYDAAGRLTLDRQNVGTLGSKDVQYGYDAAGKQTRLYLTSATYDYTFSYDPMGRFETILVTSPSTLWFQYYYDLASNEIQRLNKLNSVAQIYTPDNLNRMSRRDIKKGTTTLSYEVYGYDAMSRLTSIDREDAKRDAFGYYLNGELNSAQYGLVNNLNPNRNVTYTVDRSGNRTNVNDTGVNTIYTPNNLNQYVNTVGSNPITNGSEHELSSYQNVNYTYINDERLQTVTSGTNSYVLAYDALGRCAKRTLNSATTYYLYDGEKPIIEYNSAGAIVGRNLYGKAIDEILTRTDYVVIPAGQTYFFQQDHEGSVTHLTNTAGTVIESYRYDAFGAPTVSSTGSFNNRFKFTGREYAPTFSIYEYRARAYHPGLGRFMSEDPKGFDTQLATRIRISKESDPLRPDEKEHNLFRYCGNDPLDFTDPMGWEAEVNLFNPHTDAGMYHAAQNIKSEPGVITVAGHGNAWRMYDQNKKALDANTVKALAEKNPGYKDAKTIRLISCNVGNTDQTNSPLAAGVANVTGKITSGSNRDVIIYSDGSYKATGVLHTSDGKAYPDPHNPGKMIDFSPKIRVPYNEFPAKH